MGEGEASSYWWMRPSPIVPLGDHWEHVRQQAGVIAGAQTPVRSLDHEFTGWQGAAYDDVTIQRVSGWFSGQWEPNTFRGIAGLFSSAREVCVRTEHASPVGRTHFLYHPWVPDVFDDGNFQLNLLGIGAWVLTSAAMQPEALWASEALSLQSSVGIASSIPLTTNNHRRRSLPTGSTVL